MLCFLVTLVFLLNPDLICGADDSARINGVADFLIDRANDNYLFILEKRIKDNEAFKLYLPTTYDQLLNLDLKRVLQSSPAVWEKSIEKDLNNLSLRYKNLLRQEVNPYTSKSEREYYDILIEKAQSVRFNINGYEATLTFTASDASQEVRDVQNKMVDLYRNIASNMKNISSIANQVTIGDLRPLDKENIERALEAIYKWEEYLNSDEFSIKGKEELVGITDKYKIFLIKTREISQHVDNMTDPDLPMTMKVNSTLDVIEYFTEKQSVALFRNSVDYENHKKYFPQFKQYALFFAQIADAKDSGEVKAILKAYTLPSVSFGIKRKPKERHFTISSYLGLVSGCESRDSEIDLTRNYYFGLMAPVGIELSSAIKTRGTDWGPISIFASFLDFGPVVNARLYEKESSLELEDIIAPGFFVVYGVKELPLAVGLGYQHSKGVRTQGAAEHHILLFLAFDMPLLVLY